MSSNVDSVNLAAFSVEELNALAVMINKELERKREQERVALRQEFERKAGVLGLSVEEVIKGDNRRRKSAKRVVPAKYRNHADPSQTWSGRGKRPRWLQEQVDQGRKVEDFLIKG